MHKPENQGNSGSGPYLAYVDGLRALAVTAVLAFHAFPAALPGGFLGVDVFFVISGYLITGILVRKHRKGTFSLEDFYGRRIRRIFPALLIVLAFTCVYGLSVLGFTPMVQLARQMAGAAFFVPNLFLWSEAGYFDAAAQQKPLLHLWSLGVEEQFYLVWPFVIAVAVRSRLNLVLAITAIGGLSLACSLYLSGHDLTAAFYSPLSRAWELAAGSVVAVSPPVRSPRLRGAAASFGLLTVLAVLWLADSAQFSIGWALLSVVGTTLLLLSGEDNPVSKHVLGLPMMRGLGLVSYPLYLWHWPVLVFARLAWPGLPAPLAGAALALCLFLAIVTHTFAEKPVQNRFTPAAATWRLLPLMAVFAGMAVVLWQTNVRFLIYPPPIRQVLSYLSYDYLSDARVGTCWVDHTGKERDFDACGFKDKGSLPRIALWGDSFAGRLYPGLAAAGRGKIELASYAIDGCPLAGLVPDCRSVSEDVLGRLEQDPPGTVILYGRWASYAQDYTKEPARGALAKTISRLRSKGIAVLLMGPFPVYPSALPDAVFKAWSDSGRDSVPNRLTGLPDASTLNAERQLRAVAAAEGISYFSVIDLLCSTQGCRTSASGDPANLLSWDFGHLTTPGATFIARRLPIFGD